MGSGRLRLPTASVIGLVVVLLFAGSALFAGRLSSFDPTDTGAGPPSSSPSAEHVLGTDAAGRDVFSRLLHGGRISLAVALGSAVVSLTLGALVGLIAGYVGGWTDGVLMRITDIALAIPSIIFLLAVMAMFDRTLFLIALVIGLMQWPATARLVRGEVLKLRKTEFVMAAEALGFGTARTLLRHVAPNAISPAIVTTSLGIGNAIALEAGLSFLGVGLPRNSPSWGNLVDSGRASILVDPLQTLIPALAIVTVVVAFNLVGDGVRDWLDPRDRGPRREYRS